MTQRIFSLLLAASSLQAFAAYDLNYPADSTTGNAERHLTSLTLSINGLPKQTLQVGQEPGGKLYFDLTSQAIAALPGSLADLQLDWTGSWMNSYIYLDCGNDGNFTSEGDLLAYSNYEGKTSTGFTSGNGNRLLPPEFNIPADLQPGVYRMRLKIDWDNIDPAGSMAEGNDIVSNGGAIVDFSVLVPERYGIIDINADNGSLQLADGSDANGASVDMHSDLVLTPVGTEGYTFDGMVLSGDMKFPASLTPVCDALLPKTTTFTAADIHDGVLTVPADRLLGHLTASAHFLPASTETGTRYASVYSGEKGAADGFTSISVNGTKQTVESTSKHTAASLTFNAVRGTALTVKGDFNGSCGKFNLYVDLNQDGVYNPNTEAMSCELLASGSAAELTATLPESLRPGVYRARIEAEGHSDADFFINSHNSTITVYPKALNALITNSDESPLGETAEALTALRVRTVATVPGFEPVKAVIRHGQNLTGPEFVCGNRQWADYETKVLSSGAVNVPARYVDGDLELYVIYEESENSEWTKVWGDEFNSGKRDTKRWQYSTRAGSTWNRYVASGARQQRIVNTFENGCYNSHCIPTPAEFTTETQPMISGAICSDQKFSITYGKIEARIKTTPHKGNFPAFWMMPSYSELGDLGLSGWPRDGEIDIWEQIDDQDKAHHTVHSGWTGYRQYCGWEAPQQKSPTSSASEYCDATTWHVYALEWDAEELRWYVDGKQVFSYRNMHYSEPGSAHYVEKVTWPFDKHFYIILNQSVGNGTWAQSADLTYHYQTAFDYVRVYQKKAEKAYETKIKDNGDDPEFFVPAKGVDEEESSIAEVGMDAEDENAPVEYFDLNGRRVGRSGMIPGIYIEKQGSKASKVIIR